MASFLRRKSKQEPVKPSKQPIVISSPASPASTPLFAKFATTASSNGMSNAPRTVSSPMILSSNVRRENSTNGTVRYATGSVNMVNGRDRERSQKVNGGPPSSFQYGGQGKMTDKPLPSNPASDPRHSVSSSRNYPQPSRSRTSLSTVLDDKPLPIPGGQQPQRQRPAANERNLSIQTSSPIAISAAGRRSPAVTNLLDDEFDLTPVAATPRSSPPSAFAAQQVQRTADTNGAAQRVSYAADLPPEFALFQEFSVVSSSPPDLTLSPRAAPALESTGQQKNPSFSARSDVSEGAIAISPPTTNTSPKSPKSKAHQPTSTSQLSDMGNNMSALNASASSLYPSAIGSFQGSRAFMASSSAHSPVMSQFNSVQPKASFRQTVHPESPPPHPGAGSPITPGSPRMENGPVFTDFNVGSVTPGSLYQPTGVQTPVAPIVPGRARIFAAMNAVGNADEAVPKPLQQQSPPNRSQIAHQQPYPERRVSHILSNQFPNQPPPRLPQSPSYSGNDQRLPLSSQHSPPAMSPTFDLRSAPNNYNSNGHQPVDVLHTPRAKNSPPLPQLPAHSQHFQSNGSSTQSTQIPQSPHRPKKLSKVRQPSDVSTLLPNASSTSIMSASVESLHSSVHGHGSSVKLQRLKPIPVPLRPGSSGGHKRSTSRSPTKHEQQQQQEEQPPPHVDEETIRKAGIPLDDDPFAKVEGVRMLKSSSSPSKEGSIKRPRSKSGAEREPTTSTSSTKEDLQSVTSTSIPRESSSRRGSERKEAQEAKERRNSAVTVSNGQSPEERRKERRERRAREKEQRKAKEQEAAAAASAAIAQAEVKQKANKQEVPAAVSTTVQAEVEGEELLAATSGATTSESELDALPEIVGELEATEGVVEEPKFFPFTEFVSNPQLLANLLSFMTFYDWCILSSVSREIRIMLVQTSLLREEVLERFLKTVGYSRWAWDDKDPLSLSLQDLADYMRGVSTPSHEYARVAKMYVHSQTMHPSVRDSSLEHMVRCLTASSRAYTRVVLRLRAQAEKEASMPSAASPRSASVPPPSSAGAAKAANSYGNGHGNGYGASSRSASRPSSRAPSPTMSNYSHSHSYASSQIGQGGQHGVGVHQNSSQTSLTFRSPLFRLRRAPLLRVFIPSPEGDWLSDKSVLDCEAECKKAGVIHLMRMGDVVWDIAVGDEGNVGRLVYDGKYLIDLDYTYNPIGDLPKYVPTLAFPPSYFHRVIRTGPITSNPIAHIDVVPWGEEIAANLQLLQDRVKTETPQGAYHNVVRWVHRSSFVIRPPARVMQRGPSVNGRSQPHTPRIPIPETENLFIDSGWYGTIVVETEGTNEALADLQERCGPRAFPPRPKPANPALAKIKEENRKVFRILREKSRPGEIWIKAVSIKERLL